ncbi:MAG: thiamine-phosphate kinase [Sinobacteraceae bacterium]|nr:thiamine-phosphate kinase [Nevskiaceae bacterium]
MERYFRAAGASRSDVPIGVGDDGAILRPPPGFDLVAVSDTLVEGVHFPQGAAPRSIGHRALAVNLSDIAAMGATPAWALLSLTLPTVDEPWLAEFSAGFGVLACEHEVALVGGDTTRGPLTLGVQVLGFVPQGEGLRRSGGRPGDLLCVSGTPGDAAAGLALLQRASARPAVPSAEVSSSTLSAPLATLQQRFEYPTPRLALGARLRTLASAGIDVSDGLYGDATKLAAASGCAVHIEPQRLPCSAALTAAVAAGVFTAAEAMAFVCAGGDDYELLFTMPPAAIPALQADIDRGDVTIIGALASGAGLWLLEQGVAQPATAAGFDHFG